MKNAVWIIFGLALPALVAASLSGCATRRDYRAAYNDMRTEVLHTEQQFFELEERYRVQQAELNRIRQKQGLPPTDDDVGGEFYGPSEGPSQLAFNTPGQGSRSTGRKRGLSVRNRNGQPNRGNAQFASRNNTNRQPWNELPEQWDSDKMLGTPVDPKDILAMVGGEDEADTSADSLDEDSESTGDFQVPDLDDAIASAIRDHNEALNGEGDEEVDADRNNLHQLASSDSNSILTNSVLDEYPTHLVINSALTRGANFDETGADDGIMLVIEPRNEQDMFVPVPGPVTISLIDPAEVGDAQRIGLWKFGLEDIEARVKRQLGNGRGITILLPWPDLPPNHSQLKVFVRYETPDGRMLESSADVVVGIKGDGQVGWTVRTTPMGRPKEEWGSANQDSPTSSIATRPSDSSSPNQSSSESNPRRPEWRPYR